jgi:phosphoribosyl-ATP pyrophosphohydrolase
MGKYKGTGILSLRKIIRKHGKTVEENFLNRLSTLEKGIYQNTMAVSWIPDEIAAKVIEEAAETLFPGDKYNIRKIGREQAMTDLNGIYRIFVLCLDIYYMISQAEKLWHLYHDTGAPRAEMIKGVKNARLIVENYPDMLKGIQETISGYIIGTAELVGIRNVQVVTSNESPHTCVWNVSWE